MVYEVNRPWYDPAHGNMIMLAVYSAIWVVFTAVYFARRHVEPIKSRGWELSLFSSVYTYASFVLIALAVEGMWHDQDWSCHWYVWVVANAIPLWVYVSTFRAWRLYYNHFASQYFMRNVGVLDESVWVRRFRFTRTKSFALCLLLVISLVSYLAELGIVLSLPNYDVGTFGLICQEHTKYITMAQGVVASAIIVLLVMGLWNVEDVIGLKDELKIDMLTIVPTFGLWVIFCNAGEPAYPFTSLHLANLAIFQWFCATIIMPVVWSYRTQFDAKSSTNSLVNSPEFLNALGLKLSTGNSNSNKTQSISGTEDGVESEMTVRAPAEQTEVVKAEKKPIDSERLFRAVLDNSIMLDGFEKYAIKSWCVENVVFWIDVRAFKTDVARKDISPADKLKHAKRIYMTYVVESADLMINIDQKASTQVSTEIEKAVMDETYSVDIDMFEMAEKQVFQQMLTDTFHKWRQTEDYEVAVSRLMNFHKSSTDQVSKPKTPTGAAAADQANNQVELIVMGQ